jgi:ribonuclease BN (tRNA processing enzyme)
MDPADLDALIISHLHVDHCCDVFPLYHYLRFGAAERPPLPLIVPEGAFDRLAAFVDSGTGSRLTEFFAPHIPEMGRELLLGSMTFRFGLGDHPVPTLQLKAEAAGRSMAYSADTGLGSDLAALAAGTNTLLCEATFQGAAKPAPHHLTAAEAGGIARQAGVERLILTHLTPTLDPQQSIAEAVAEFDGDVMVAAPGLEVLI